MFLPLEDLNLALETNGGQRDSKGFVGQSGGGLETSRHVNNPTFQVGIHDVYTRMKQRGSELAHIKSNAAESGRKK
jgi:hypothetical protein